MLVRAIETLSDLLIRYDYTAGLSRANWAWEFARRNPDLRDDAFAGLSRTQPRTACHGIRLIRLPEPDLTAEAWGLLRFPNPDRPAFSIDLFWSCQAYPRMLGVHVRDRIPGETDGIFEKGMRLCKITHLTDAFGREHLCVRGASRAVQLRCSGKSLLGTQPMKMEFCMTGPESPDRFVQTLKRAHFVFQSPRRTPAWSGRALRYRNALIALDAHEAGMSYRDMATIFHGEQGGSSDWTGAFHAKKSSMARLLAKGQRLRDGGYRDLLGTCI